MNPKMWEDLTTALMQRLTNSFNETGAGLLARDQSGDPAAALRRQAAQMEVEMNRFRQVFRFIQADRFEQAYNVLDTVGQTAEAPEPEPAPEPEATA